ncbi:glycosyltransferase [Roseovarius spongiae]|uniref:Glycosyltransferase n=1 Tax=Roseovarius spongiae TaxID=2320272 RepID=A0A3A8ARG3_9RHOB|nr:glycosyltransferase family 4 protein [Roseovarius spongiae]RKF13480.1 glycosyltransferase [Roseovarius spongiae]
MGGDGGRSGVPTHLRQLCETLRGRAEITVASDVNAGGYDGITRAGARHMELPGLRSSLDPRMAWRGWRAVLWLARAAPWDVIWLHARLPALLLRLALALGLLRLSSDARVVLSYHGLPFDPGHRPLAVWASRRMERFLLARCPPMDLVVLSRSMAIALERGVGRARLARHRLHVLANSSHLGVLPQARTGRNHRRLVVTGRAGYQKNYTRAVRLMEHLPADYSLTLCGTGSDDPAVQAHLLDRLDPGARARIHFAGSLADIRPLLAEADGYLLTSRYEGLPIGAIEAFEAGLPLILGPFDTAPDLITGHPMALCVALQDLPRDAARVTALVEAFARDRLANSARIRAAWRRSYPFDRWQADARTLLDSVLAPSQTPIRADETARTQPSARLRACRSSASSRSS